MLENSKNSVIDELNCPTHPPYTANFLLSLVKDKASGEYKVRVRYNDLDYSPCRDGESSCEVGKFVKIMEKRIISREEYLRRCGKGDNSGVVDKSLSTIPLWAFAVFGVVLVLLVFSVVFNLRKGREETAGDGDEKLLRA
jgi:hypothetical protein